MPQENSTNVSPSTDTSSLNTVLLVIILLILVGVGVWWMSTHKISAVTPSNDSRGINIDVTLPPSNTSPSATPNPQ
jgi:multidrug efflux pump subunit AcrB